MSYTYYCFGLAAQAVDSELTEEDAAAYAIGSLDRLHKVKLPRCRKEVEDAIAALSDPNYVTITQQWQERCDRLQAERDEYHNLLDAAEEARQFLEAQRDFVEAYGVEEYSRLRQTIDASKRNTDGSLNGIAVDAAILSHMLARLPAPK